MWAHVTFYQGRAPTVEHRWSTGHVTPHPRSCHPDRNWNCPLKRQQAGQMEWFSVRLAPFHRYRNPNPDLHMAHGPGHQGTQARVAYIPSLSVTHTGNLCFPSPHHRFCRLGGLGSTSEQLVSLNSKLKLLSGHFRPLQLRDHRQEAESPHIQQDVSSPPDLTTHQTTSVNSWYAHFLSKTQSSQAL